MWQVCRARRRSRRARPNTQVASGVRPAQPPRRVSPRPEPPRHVLCGTALRYVCEIRICTTHAPGRVPVRREAAAAAVLASGVAGGLLPPVSVGVLCMKGLASNLAARAGRMAWACASAILALRIRSPGHRAGLVNPLPDPRSPNSEREESEISDRSLTPPWAATDRDCGTVGRVWIDTN